MHHGWVERESLLVRSCGANEEGKGLRKEKDLNTAQEH